MNAKPTDTALVAGIRAAFANTKPPAGELFATSNAEGAERVFTNRRWEDIDAAELNYHGFAAGFLRPHAFSYFLPAFMIVSLSEPGLRDTLLSTLLPPNGDASRSVFTSWWNLLSQPQKRVVVDFVEHCDRDGAIFPDVSYRALRNLVGQ